MASENAESDFSHQGGLERARAPGEGGIVACDRCCCSREMLPALLARRTGQRLRIGREHGGGQ